MNDFKSTRVALGDALLELADSGLDFVAVAADTSKSMTVSILKDKYPDRIYDCGIAEQNMIMISAGLASTGKIVFAASYSTFTSMRVLKQLRTFICYPDLNVKILAGMGDISCGIEGATHMALEDLGIVRCIPNLVVVNPSDYYCTKKAVIEAAKVKSPCYIRVGRDATPVIFDDNYKFYIGKTNLLEDNGNGFGIISSGIILSRVLDAAKKLRDHGYKFKLLDMPTIKPIDKQSIINLAKQTKKIFTIEEHNVIGGLYLAVCEVLCNNYPIYVYPIATNDIFGESGTPAELARKYNLDAEGIFDQLKKI